MNFQDLMNAFHINDDLCNQVVYKDLLVQIKRNRVIPVLGAGLSAWAGYPLWGNLLADKAKELPTEEEILEKLKQEEYEKAASLIEKAYGPDSFRNMLKRAYTPSKCKEENRPDYQLKMKELFSGTIVTTNYDICLEKLYSLTTSFTPENSYQTEALNEGIASGDNVLVKLHGTINDRSHIILTEEQYNRVYGTNPDEPDFSLSLPVVLRNIFMASTPLFLGCGLGPDRTCAVLSSCLGARGFALLELPKETENVDDPNKPILKAEKRIIPSLATKRARLEKMRVQTIWYPYGQHEAVSVLINQLWTELYGPKNTSPQKNKTEKKETGKIHTKPTKNTRITTRNDFLNKLYELYYKDGMMRALYKLFHQHINERGMTADKLVLLSMVQDEYKKVYDQYSTTKTVNEKERLEKLLANKTVQSLINDKSTHPLLCTYLQFIEADKMYFDEEYSKAIQLYQRALNQIKNNNLSDLDKERCVYLLNSIAWSYHLRNQHGDNQKAIEIYQNLFEKYKDADEYSFSLTYRRNYGVCLEKEGKYTEALEQYDWALHNSKGGNKGILFLTYSAVMMKYWDNATGKTTGEWIDRIKQTYTNEEKQLTDEVISSIETNLNLAYNQVQPRLYPDIYNQKTKLLTYKMVLAKNQSERNKYIGAIKGNLKTLEEISGNATGWLYIKRDFYYALYEMTKEKIKKKEYYQIAWEENKRLNRAGDSDAFGKMLENEN